MVCVFEDIESDRVLYIREIKEDDIIASGFWYLTKNLFIEVSMRIYQSYSSPSIYILENHPLEHRSFTASCHSYHEHMSLECFCIHANMFVILVSSECYTFARACYLLDNCLHFFCFWSDIFGGYFYSFFSL